MSTSPIRRLIENLNRASVWQVFVAYIGFGWLVLEVAEHLVGQWGLPDQAYRVAVTLLLIGLPGVLGTAYVQRRRLHASAQAPVGAGERHAPFSTLAPLATAVAAGGRLGRLLSWRNTIVGSVGALAIWGLFAAFWVLTHPGFTPGPAVGAANFASILPVAAREYKAGVAVVMLRDLSPDSAHSHLAEGLTDELIHALSHVEGLKVPSFTSMVALKNSELTTPEIGRRLGVGHTLEGTIQGQGERVRVLVQLINASVDSHEWSLEFDGLVTEPLTLREQIAETVIDSLLAHLPVLERGTASESVRESPAHGAYLAGKSALSQRTSAGIRSALLSFQEAIELDSTYAPAYAGLASTYGLSITYRTRLPLNAYSAAGYAMRISRRGIELAPDLAEAYAAHGYVSSLSFAPTETVLADFGRALQLEPDAPEVPGWFAHLLVREGRVEEALAEARRSVSLSPLAPGRRLGLSYEALRIRDYGLALSEAREASALAPGLMLARVLEARALLLLNRPQECLELDPGPYVGTRASCLHTVGRSDEAAALIATLRRSLEANAYSNPDFTEVLPSEDLAVYYAWIGDTELSIEWLDRTFGSSPSGVDGRTIESGLFDRVLDSSDFRPELARLRAQAWARVDRLASSQDPLPRLTPADITGGKD